MWPDLTFTISRDESEGGVPAATLARVLEGAQRAIHLLAMVHEQRDILHRARIPSEIERKYTIVCGLPQHGSYVLPAKVVGESDLLSPHDVPAVVSLFMDFGEAVASANREAARALVSDRTLRARVLDAFRTLAPKAGAGWRLRLGGAGRAPIELGEEHLRFISHQLKPTGDEPNVGTVTGSVERIDFGERKVTLLFAPTGKQLECTYKDGVEDMLLENRRDMVQVTGSVILDDKGFPAKIIEAFEIQDLDLSPFELSEVPYQSGRLRVRSPLVLMPNLDESQQLLVIDDDRLGIHVYAHTRELLQQELQSQLVVLWEEFACERDEVLTAEARALKERLLQLLEKR